jgi:hypothetical protein
MTSFYFSLVHSSEMTINGIKEEKEGKIEGENYM